MANPQKENGHIGIANEIAEAFAKNRLSGQEWQVLWVILRKTWGWHKKEDKISMGQISKLTGIPRSRICLILQALIEKNVVTKNGNTFPVSYSFRKDYEKWEVLPKKVTVFPKMVTPVIKNGNSLNKISTKENITKENYSQNSDEFRLSLLLFSLIRERNKNFKKELSTENQINGLIQKWAVHIDRLVRINKRSPEQIEMIIRVCQENDFWQDNILSTAKLRQQFDQLELKLGSGNKEESIKLVDKAFSSLSRLGGKKPVMRELKTLPSYLWGKLRDKYVKFYSRDPQAPHSFDMAIEELRKNGG